MDMDTLVPSDTLVMKLRSEIIPHLIILAEKEQDIGSFNSLQHILQLFFFYNYLTEEKKKEDPFDPKIIDLLPIMVKISQKLLKNSASYKDDALTFGKWLKCKSVLNPQCEITEEHIRAEAGERDQD